jgi:hypothetical protein
MIDGPSHRDLCALAGLRSPRGITLTFTRLSDQLPQARLQSGPVAGIAQASTGKLLSLYCITLSKAHLSETVKHLRFPRSDTLGALKTRCCTVEIATTLLLLSCSQ